MKAHQIKIKRRRKKPIFLDAPLMENRHGPNGQQANQLADGLEVSTA